MKTSRWTRIRTMLWTALLAVTLACAGGLQTAAVQPDEVLKDPGLEARARALSAELRCLVCQNQSIDDSDAPLAKDLRVLVRERIVAGESDAQVMDYIVARYGEFVLLRPRFGWHTALLWLAPILVLMGGVMLARHAFRPRPLADARDVSRPLSDNEKRLLEQIIAEPDPNSRVSGTRDGGGSNTG
jgi:cytochrome c-type biogenesis protein CcmH